MKYKVYKTLFILLMIAVVAVIGLIIHKYGSNYLNDQEMKKIVDQVSAISIDDEPIDVEIEGYKVIGIIKIEKIGLEYPILEKTTDHVMKISISRFWGGEVNEIGNLALAGHNNKDGTMFGKTKRLEIGDIIELTDLNKNTIQYSIYDIYVVGPNDVSILNQEQEGTREVTLITCTNGNKNRLITKAREI